jgi:aconitate hydratase
VGQTATVTNSFDSRAQLSVGGRSYEIFRLDALREADRLPYSLKVLLENLLRHEDGVSVRAADIEALANWSGQVSEQEITFAPARILMQDFTGVPAVVDLAAMRDAIALLGGDVTKVNPLVPADLVIDHSVVVDAYARVDAAEINARLEFERNQERYRFLRWGQGAFDNFRVVPPDTGICHQVNLEYLARVVWTNASGQAYPDTLVGTDSHTTMINGLSVVGWGVGGIEAEAAMLGQPIPMLIPSVIGVKLVGQLPDGATATDLVLTVTEVLRQRGVVGKFVEFYGPGVANVPVENRATLGNMTPEYGSTVTIFPVDAETLRYLRFTGRAEESVALVEAYTKEQGLWHEPSVEPVFTESFELDLSTIVPSLAGPSRPQDRVPLSASKSMFATALVGSLPSGDAGGGSGPGEEGGSGGAIPAGVPSERPRRPVPVELEDGTQFDLDHGHVVIAAITSCTNTSNPFVMVGAGLLARNAVDRGLSVKPWVKTSLAPGSTVVSGYLAAAGLTPYLDKLGFNVVGYGCTTCIGNSGPLKPEISAAINDHDLAAVSVLSGNRNFEGRINPDVRMNYLASPPLVVAYALAGTMDVDLATEPLGTDAEGQDVFLRDVWPHGAEIAETVREAVQSAMFHKSYGAVFDGDERWQGLGVPSGARYAWDPKSTYVRQPPYFEGFTAEPSPVADIADARVLAVLGDSVTTDHISPAGSIKPTSPAGAWLMDGGADPADFNSYGARRGNHEVMIRGTFANIRLRNRMVPGVEGGFTLYLPTGEQMSIYDAAMRYVRDAVPLIILAGKEYGSGSSRDWAAKGTYLLGVRAVIAESFERIHRSNLIGMGVLPLQFLPGDSVESLGLTGTEVMSVERLPQGDVPRELSVQADDRKFGARVRIDTPKEAEYYRHGGILQYVARQLLQG